MVKIVPILGCIEIDQAGNPAGMIHCEARHLSSSDRVPHDDGSADFECIKTLQDIG